MSKPEPEDDSAKDDEPRQDDVARELLEYQLTDKVQDRILSRATFLVGAFLAGLTAFGIVGTSYLIDYLGDRVSSEVKDDVAKQTETLRRHLQEALVELSVTTAEIKRDSEKARAQLDALARDSVALQEMQAGYEKLQHDVAAMGKATADAAKLAQRASESTSVLGDAIISAAQGKPTVLSHGPAGWDETERTPIGYRVDGAYLGSTGLVRLKVVLAYHEKPDGPQLWAEMDWFRSEPLVVDKESIAEWTDTRIRLEFTANMRATIIAAARKIRGKAPDPRRPFLTVDTTSIEMTNSMGLRIPVTHSWEWGIETEDN